MTSKWIEELEEYNSYEDRGYAWVYGILPILERINTLLRSASLETDNEDLHEAIEGELNGTD